MGNGCVVRGDVVGRSGSQVWLFGVTGLVVQCDKESSLVTSKTRVLK